MTKFGFHFSEYVLGMTQGSRDPRREHFRRIGPVNALVRELGQNSLDAKKPDSDEPVRMIFELKKWPTRNLYDYRNLREHIEAAHVATNALPGTNAEFENAVEALSQEEQYILRVSDYNTTGLVGDEDDVNSSLAALTRTSGVSAKPRGGGGSFGIGAATAALNSRILTVYWTTLREDDPQIVVAGRSDLASHRIGSKQFNPSGILLDMDSTQQFKYLRNNDQFLGFEPRSEPGTDTYIPGFGAAESDPELLRVRQAFVENFFASIKAGQLEVTGTSPLGTWQLDATTLETEIDDFPEVKPFYDALNLPPVEGQIEGLGEVKLFVNLNPGLTKKFHTVLMRKPLMKISVYKPRVNPKYAAVFVCASDEGNEKLRDLEPPTHDDWVRDDPEFPEGRTLVNRIRSFIRETIENLVTTNDGEEIRLEGLKELLPSGLGNPDLDEVMASSDPATSDEAGDEESSTLQGDPNHDQVRRKAEGILKPQVRKPGQSPGNHDARGGVRRRSSGSKKSEGGSSAGTGSPGDGTASVADGLIDMRAWPDTANGVLKLWLSARPGTSGDLILSAEGEQGLEEDFDLGIERVWVEEGSDGSTIDFAKNRLLNLEFTEERTEMTLNVKLRQLRRLKIGVI